MFGNVVYTTTNTNTHTHRNDITYFDNIIEEIPNTLYNMLRILPNNSIENNILNQSLYDKPKYKKVISKEDMDKYLKISKYNVDDKELLNTCCPIFQIDFKNDDDIIKLPCKHCFNPEAIKKWLKEEKNECPVCRYEFNYEEIVNKEAVITQDDEESNINDNLAGSLIRSYSLPQDDNNWNTHSSTVRPHNISLINVIMNEIIEQEHQYELQQALLNSLDE